MTEAHSADNLGRLCQWLKRFSPWRDASTEPDAAVVSRDYDDRANRATTPPPEERIDFRCIWAIECYTSSQFQGLVDNFSKLGWKERFTLNSYSDPVLWLKQLRGSRFPGGSLNLGHIVTEEGPYSIGGNRIVPELPRHAKYALGWIECLTPSLVAISLCFVLDEDLSIGVNESLRKYRTSYGVPISGGIEIRDARAQKHADFEAFRRDLHESVADWFSQYIPGMFASADGETPTCELVTANLARPYIKGEGDAPNMFSYVPIVGFVAGLNSWRNQRMPGLIVDLPTDSWHGLVSANEAQLKSAVGKWDSSSRDGTSTWMDLELSSILKLWAVIPLLEQLVRTTDGQLIPIADDPEQAMEALRRGAMSRVDISALTTELANDISEDRWTRRTGGRFEKAISRGEAEEGLAATLVYIVQRKAAWLRDADRAAREMAGLYGGLLGSVGNIRLQKSIRRLTWFLALLAMLAIVSPVVAATCL